MARFVKNPGIGKSVSQAARLPIVPSSGYGDAPVNGLIRFNQATSRIEFYYNNAWSQIAKIGTVQIIVDSFSGDGTTSTFVMTQSETDPTAVAVFVGGVYQQPNINYTVAGTTIIFTSAPPAPTIVSPSAIVVIHNLNSTNVAA
jgi:hypothetical protein